MIVAMTSDLHISGEEESLRPANRSGSDHRKAASPTISFDIVQTPCFQGVSRRCAMKLQGVSRAILTFMVEFDIISA